MNKQTLWKYCAFCPRCESIIYLVWIRKWIRMFKVLSAEHVMEFGVIKRNKVRFKTTKCILHHSCKFLQLLRSSYENIMCFRNACFASAQCENSFLTLLFIECKKLQSCRSHLGHSYCY